jgi:hypothetical protein
MIFDSFFRFAGSACAGIRLIRLILCKQSGRADDVVKKNFFVVLQKNKIQRSAKILIHELKAF